MNGDQVVDLQEVVGQLPTGLLDSAHSLLQSLSRGWLAYLATLGWLILLEHLAERSHRSRWSLRVRLGVCLFQALSSAALLFFLLPIEQVPFGEEFQTWLSRIVLPHGMLPGLAVCAAWIVRRHPLLMVESFPAFCLAWPVTLLLAGYHEYPMHLFSALDFHQGLPCICADHEGVWRAPYYLLRTLMQMCEATCFGLMSVSGLYGLSSLILRRKGSEYEQQAQEAPTKRIEKQLWHVTIWTWIVMALWLVVGFTTWWYGFNPLWFYIPLILVPIGWAWLAVKWQALYLQPEPETSSQKESSVTST